MKNILASVWLLYDLAFALFLLLGGPLLLLAKGRHYLQTLQGRLTLDLPTSIRGGEGSAPTKGLLWLHAVSVGEATVAATIGRALPDDLPLLVTTVTPTGQRRARELLGDRSAVGYLPFDIGPLVRRFLNHVEPDALVLVEGDYWPRLLAAAADDRLPVAVVNGRVGDRTFRRSRRLKPVARWLLNRVERFGVQSTDDRTRLEELGVPASQIRVTGNLKYERDRPDPLPDLQRRIERLAAGRPVLIAGSTMDGEEEKVAAAFATLGGGERALLIVAPRHPERWDEVERRLDELGLDVARRSRLDTSETDAADVLLLDSLGELASLYGVADAAFVGGTLVATGGHNPLEPAVFGCPIAVGPSMENFRDMERTFERADAWRRVGDADELADVWDRWLRDPASGAEIGERARALVDANRGALDETLTLLESLLSEVGELDDVSRTGRAS